MVGNAGGPAPPGNDCCCDPSCEAGVGVFAGAAVYYQDEETVGPTDARHINNQSRFVGFWTGSPSVDPTCGDNNVKMTGLFGAALFTTDGGAPTPGSPCYLAEGSADGGFGLGKLTATPPATVGSVIAEVGIVKDPTFYPDLVVVLIQPKEPKVIS